ncbi:MAG: BMP family ABC transporter substrate-binding protein [Zhongshania sp.]|uniref:BMP family ABC transporter substrate-binding protein n=1 Tax=Zhongshania sp. TaxID=1971902 RepID=UPI00262BC214|nr:BMP family ABC transporter substrate-binding protein [Zhongshania sp.]MDF1691275.1 BMP family ABC transporter substrate-binding protein [Zhongshania sp.]
MKQKSQLSLSRRKFVKTASIAAAGLSMALKTPLALAAAKVKMGFVYVGPRDDYGYNQAHFEGKAALAALDWVKAVDEENVPETIEVQKTMESMIQLDGAQVLFPTSFGYFDPHILKIAKRYPDTTFLHCGGLWDAEKHPKNVGSYFGYIDEPVYISGIVAGHMSKSKKLGFIAAIPIPQVLRNINNFTMAARSIDPSITTTVVFTGGWSDPVKEAEAANSLVDQGIDVLTCHVDSPKVVVETAEKRGIYSCGYHTNNAVLAPKGFLTGAEWSWATVYKNYAELIKNKQPIPNLVRGGLKDGIVKVSPYGAVVSDAAKADADKALASFMDGSMVVYKGPIKDNKGNTVIPKGKSYLQTDTWLESMDWLVEGVVG